MYQHEQTRANKDASSTRNRIFLRNKDQIAQKKSAVSFRTMVLILLELVKRCLSTYKDTGSHFWFVEKKDTFFSRYQVKAFSGFTPIRSTTQHFHDEKKKKCIINRLDPCELNRYS